MTRCNASHPNLVDFEREHTICDKKSTAAFQRQAVRKAYLDLVTAATTLVAVARGETATGDICQSSRALHGILSVEVVYYRARTAVKMHDVLLADILLGHS